MISTPQPGVNLRRTGQNERKWLNFFKLGRPPSEGPQPFYNRSSHRGIFPKVVMTGVTVRVERACAL
jgi:hypothetical protein